MMEKAEYFRVDLHTNNDMPAVGNITTTNLTTTGADLTYSVTYGTLIE